MINLNKSPVIKQSLAIFLRIVIVLIGLLVLSGLLWEPLTEGRNIHATLVQVYFNDPFLAYVYLMSIPFFTGLYQSFKMFSYTSDHKVFLPIALKSLQIIRYCAFITAGAIVAADGYLMIAHAPNDDPTGAVMLGAVATVISITIGIVSVIFELAVRDTMDADLKAV